MCKELEKKAKFYGAFIVDYDFPPAIRYAYHNGVIGINKAIVDYAERRTIIALGIGRHLMRNNNCIFLSDDQANIAALHWAVTYLMPFSAFIEANKLGLNSGVEFADYLGITPQFMNTGINVYRNIYGNRILYQDCVIDLENERLDYMKEVG